MSDVARFHPPPDHQIAALANALGPPATPADAFDIMPAAEQALVLHTWSETAAGHQAGLMRRLAEAATGRTPEADAAILPFGPPGADMRMYVLDSRLRPVPVGVPGQLFISG